MYREFVCQFSKKKKEKVRCRDRVRQRGENGVEGSVSSGGANPRDSCTANVVNLSRAFFTLAKSRRGLFGARVRRQHNPLEHHALHPPLFHYLRKRNEAPSDRGHRRRCGSKLDDLVKSKTPDPSFFARENKLN